MEQDVYGGYVHFCVEICGVEPGMSPTPAPVNRIKLNPWILNQSGVYPRFTD